jgi:hypothetical protein
MTLGAGYDWATWRMGIMRSLISGGSSSMVSGLAGIGIAPGTFNLTGNLSNTLKLMSVMFLFQGGYRMFEFLALHPIPDPVAAAQAIQSAQAAAKQTVAAIAEVKDKMAPKD